MEKERKLNRQQRLFCYEYLIDYNATQAAIRAGYSAKNSQRIGFELLNKTQVKTRIDDIHSARERVAQCTAAKVEEEVQKVAMMNPEDFVMAIGKGYVMTMQHKLKALEMLCRIKGMFNDKLEFTFKGMSKEQVKAVLMEWIKAHGDRPGLPENCRLVSQGG